MASAAINPLNKVVSPISKTAPLKVKNRQAINGAMKIGAIYGAGTGEGNSFNQFKNIAIGTTGGATGHISSKFINKNITQSLNSQILRHGINSSVENVTSNFIQKQLKDKKS